MAFTETSIARRALRTTEAAKYLGISPSLLRKMRSRGVDDPLGPGPKFIRLSASLVVYDITALDNWLDQRDAVMQRQRAGAAGTRQA
jgi:predicted DNA-binding transcriptional regulator AlpA